MNQLSTAPESKAFNALSAHQQEWVSPRLEPSFKNLNQYEQKNGCREIINISYIESGHKDTLSPEIIVFQSQALYDELKSKFGILTLSEIKRAFKKGVRGEYGSWFGMCAKSYHQFLKGYFDSPERSGAFSQYLDRVDKENFKTFASPVLSDSEKNDVIWQCIINECARYKASGNLVLFPKITDIFYEYLTKRNLINLSAADKENMNRQAQLEIKRHKYYTEDYITGIFGNETLKSLRRKAAIKKYFDGI